MADLDITDAILRAALNKHADNGDIDQFERALTASRGNAAAMLRQDRTTVDPALTIPAVTPTSVIGTDASTAVLAELARVSPPRLANRYKPSTPTDGEGA